MGSLTSRPKAAPAPQIVYVPSPAPTPAPASISTSATSPAPVAANTSNAEQAEQKQREENLLRRDRGRRGTVQTGFRGVLKAVDTAAQKKTLLGQ